MSILSLPLKRDPFADEQIDLMTRAPTVDLRYCETLRREGSTEADTSLALRALENQMSMVPAGPALVANYSASFYGQVGKLDASTDESVQFDVDSYYMDRFAVTNEDYLAFIEAGGYECGELWPEEIYSNVLQFVDQTGCPGPKFWKNGRSEKGRGKHPVVGICWYEANAFATWAGKRLPTSAEWQRAGTWAGETAERRFPWGNSFDATRSNTSSANLFDTVKVDAFANGATPNGIFQLSGNVWEWVGTLFECPDGRDGTRIIMEQPMAEIRGGAFDTYFASQTSCAFRTGQSMLARRDNLGFRCCVSLDGLRLPFDPFAFIDEEYA